VSLVRPATVSAQELGMVRKNVLYGYQQRICNRYFRIAEARNVLYEQHEKE
jgi:propanediol dehydratase small subunit